VAVDAAPLIHKNKSMPQPAIETESLTKDYPTGFLHMKQKDLWKT